jgi:dGTPase
MADKDHACFDELHNFLYDRVYLNYSAKAEEAKVDGIIGGIFTYLTKNPQFMPEQYARVVASEGIERAVTDYIAGMTDTFAIKFFENVYIPKSWNI